MTMHTTVPTACVCERGASPLGFDSPRHLGTSPSWGTYKEISSVANTGDNAGLWDPEFRVLGDDFLTEGALGPQKNGRGAQPLVLPFKDYKPNRTEYKKIKESRVRSRPTRNLRELDNSRIDQNRFLPISGSECEGPEDLSCTKSGGLRGKAQALIRHLSGELGIKPERDLPERIDCGGLRAAVRSVFASELTLVQELSIKTSQKVERGCCKNCLPKFEQKMNDWMEARFQPALVDDDHVTRFSRALLANVPNGWNAHVGPYIPNGSGTLNYGRQKGGNWNKDEFSDLCRAELVFSSGKPRIVTLYSEHNTRTLTPLHNSLYKKLEKRGWLLVGPPTNARINRLNGGGSYQSVDYEGATDNIKTRYVRASIAVLKSQANPPLTADESKCLDVLGELKFKTLEGDLLGYDPSAPSATRGQPMGSVMSFPLLCLINKTVVDLALSDMLMAGEISFREWSSHRCLINGDDLLFKEPRKSSSLFEGIVRHGAHVGLKTNSEKTLTDSDLAEINSTAFMCGSIEKKVNCSALYMKPETDDVVGYALEATTSVEGFRRVLRANANLLARAPLKRIRRLPPSYQRVCRKDKKIKRALCSVPVQIGEPTAPTNLLPMAERPCGYDLDRTEEIAAIHDAVDRVRGRACLEASNRKRKIKGKKMVLRDARSYRSVLFEKDTTADKDYILSCLVGRWYKKQWDILVEEANEIRPYAGELPPSDAPNKCEHLLDAIRGWKSRRSRQEPQYVGTMSKVFENGSDWIPIE